MAVAAAVDRCYCGGIGGDRCDVGSGGVISMMVAEKLLPLWGRVRTCFAGEGYGGVCDGE